MSLAQFVEHWLNAIPDLSLANPTSFPQNKKRKLVQEVSSPITPPTSNDDMSDRRHSPKRKRSDQRDHDATPRSNQVTPFNDRPVPLRLSNIPSIPPSESSFASQSSVGTSPSRKVRSKSPVKDNNSLQALDVPVDFVKLGNDGIDQLPSDVHDLYGRLQDINDKEEFIPGTMKEDIKNVIRRVKERWFTASQDPSPRDLLSQELKLLQQIEDDAEQCEHSDCSEASWNMHVHMPILRHAFSTHSTIRVEPAMSAKIAPSFVPTVNGRATVIESKMIDFTLLLWLNRGSPRNTAHNAVVSDADFRLMNSIAKTVWRQPIENQFINQSSYAPLRFAPIAVNIETKTATSANQGKLQLSVWIASWFKRISELGLRGGRIPTIPLIHVVGHEWHISFASWHESRIEIAEELGIGDTRTLVGLYQLVASLRGIGEWIETVYRAWVEEAFREALEVDENESSDFAH